MEGNGKTTEQINVEAYLENMRRMNGIIAEMKEIPVLPSEKPDDVRALTKVEFPGEGGMLTYMDGFQNPYAGFPFFEIVEKIDLIKKLTRGTLSGLYHSIKNKWFLLFTLFPAMWILKDFVRTGLYTFYRMIERSRIKPVRYCQAIRELYRCFSVPRGEDAITQEVRLMLRDTVCMILEFDNAYRFRFQDVLPEMHRVEMKSHTVRELNRLLDIAISRENTQEIKDTWKLLKLGISLYLRFDFKLKRMIGDVLSQIDVGKVRLTEGDMEFCLKRKDYKFIQ